MKNKRSFPKQLLLIMTLLMIPLSFISCSDDNDTSIPLIAEDNLPNIENGRFVFENSDHYVQFVEDLSAIKQLSKAENFKSLRSIVNDNETGYADFILDLYNENREIQIGSNIIYIKNWTQYLIPNQDESLLQSIKRKLTQNQKILSKNVTVFNIEKQKIPLQINENAQAKWSHAKYQHEVHHPSYAPMKFVYEAFLNKTYYMSGPFTFALSIDTGVNSKYEWRHGKYIWKPAGEVIIKEAFDVTIQLTNTDTGANIFQSVPYRKQVSNTDMIIRAPKFNAIPGNLNYRLVIKGRLKSKDPTKPDTLFFEYRFEYDQECEWVANFVI
ncbi:hypothetical protein [Tenacibaculum amylolyticum]|uniref:hypothetical protein n=1 Tax=Tenacibaculum amylolyticum TaxID=104269 RepID=UPI003893EE37